LRECVPRPPMAVVREKYWAIMNTPGPERDELVRKGQELTFAWGRMENPARSRKR
jgi:hypothetical protein